MTAGADAWVGASAARARAGRRGPRGSGSGWRGGLAPAHGGWAGCCAGPWGEGAGPER
jgi:hypothetical protein